MDGNFLETPSGALINSPSSLLMDSLTTSTQSFPWGLVLAVAPSILEAIFGKSEEEKMLDKAQQMKNILNQLGLKPPYQSPFTGTGDRAFAQALFNRLSKMGNWGWPQGMGSDFSFFSDFMNNFTSPVGTGPKIRKS
jgi:hypothetical protein